MHPIDGFKLKHNILAARDQEHRTSRLAAAIEYLGPKWVLHPARRIPKGSYKEPIVQRVDVAATFKAARKRLNLEASDAQQL